MEIDQEIRIEILETRVEELTQDLITANKAINEMVDLHKLTRDLLADLNGRISTVARFAFIDQINSAGDDT